MGFRKTAVALTVLALALATTGCKARERYLNAREAYDASSPLICDEDFGRYYFDAGWVEDGSGDPASHSYCLAEDIDNPDRPYTVTVTYDETDDSHGDKYMFGDIEYTALVEEYGEDAVTVTGNGGFDDNGFASFEIRTDDGCIYRWYLINDYGYVLFELTADDEDYVQQHGLSDAVDSAFCTFHFER